MSKEQEAPLAKPRMAIRVGLIGNRNFGGKINVGTQREKDLGEPDTIRANAVAAARQVLGKIAGELIVASQEEGNRPYYSKEKPHLVMLSGLAEGADQFLAEEGFRIGDEQGQVEVALDGIFPFGEEDYPNKDDFRDLDGFRSLEKRARSIIRLDGDYGHQDLPDHPSMARRRRHRAYCCQRDMLLEHSDLVVAVWDPRQEPKRAGTLETVELALARGIEVIAIQPDDRGCSILFLSDVQDLDRYSDGMDWESRVRPAIHAIVDFPKQRARGHAAHVHAGPPPSFEIFIGAKAYRAGRIKRAVVRLVENFAKWGSKPNPDSQVVVDPESAPAEAQPYLLLQKRAAYLAREFNTQYRGAFILSYLLAILAVVIAVSSVATYHFHGAKLASLGVIVLALVKLTVIGILIWQRWQAKREEWHERGADFRLLAEMFRPMQYLAPLGIHTPYSRFPAHFAGYDPRNSWMHWFFQSTLRNQPLVISGGQAQSRFSFSENTAKSALKSVINFWLPEQIAFQSGKSVRMGNLFHRLEAINGTLLWIVIAAVAAHLTFDVIVHFSHGEKDDAEAAQAAARLDAPVLVANPGGGKKAHGGGLDFLVSPPVALPLLCIAVILPATMAGLSGLLYQYDARRESERTGSMAQVLRNQRILLAPYMESSAAWHPLGCHGWEAAIRSQRVAQLMMDETADWQIAARMDEVKAG